MKALTLVLALVMCLGLSSQAISATKVEVDLEDLNSTTRNNVLEAIKKQNEGLGAITDADPGKIKAWSTLFTTTIKDVCQTLNVEVNAFISTPVGMLTAGLIAYKVLGEDLRGIIFGLGAWFAVVPILFYVFAKYNFPKKFKVYHEVAGKKALKEIKYIPRVKHEDRHGTDYTDSWRVVVSAICAVMFAAITITAVVLCAG